MGVFLHHLNQSKQVKKTLKKGSSSEDKTIGQIFQHDCLQAWQFAKIDKENKGS